LPTLIVTVTSVTVCDKERVSQIHDAIMCSKMKPQTINFVLEKDTSNSTLVD